MTRQGTVVANLDCQPDSVWSHLQDKSLVCQLECFQEGLISERRPSPGVGGTFVLGLDIRGSEGEAVCLPTFASCW